MGTSSISWLQGSDGRPGKVWNPVTGCTKISEGCKNCYAEGIAKRFWKDRKFTDVQCHDERLCQPFHWKKPQRIFVNSMSDLFHEDVPDDFIWRVWDVMSTVDQHIYLILTKRPKRMWDFMWQWCKNVACWEPLPNVWLGVSCENQEQADKRIPILLQTPAALRFVSCEPLLGPIDLMAIDYGCLIALFSWERRLDWVIAGGESGPNFRPMNLDWARSLRDQCLGAGVPLYFKQESGLKPGTNPLLDGVAYKQFPEVTNG